MYVKKILKNVSTVSLATILGIGCTLVQPANILALESTVSTKEASENTYFENLDYSKNYNFSDLQFVPEKLTGNALESNVINFEMLGKHNIAASTDNWEIRLQIDERIAKYIAKIEIDAKKGTFANRRIFVRMADTLGRSTNIWKVNYIRANGGLFAGAETTDTQTAPNGVITLEKPLIEILNEIGDKDLHNNKLMYRVYLVSHQDDDKIVPGIESTGYFIDDNTLFVDSENNNEEFKHGSLSVKYEAADINTKDKTGNTGANGAFILDHKITKARNFSYSISATGTPWNINFKVDPRLVPYINGVELHKVFANKTVYDVSYKTGTKVADMYIERRNGFANYGLATITDNDLTNLVSFSNASPRPIVIRHVLKLSQPLDKIMEVLKEKENILNNESYGEDFIFDAWLSDTNNKNIVGTFGTGYYYLQDIDGDGKVDELEINKKTSQYVGKPKLDDVYDVDQVVKGEVYLNELAGQGNIIQLVDKNGKILEEKQIAPINANGTYKSGKVSFEFNNFDHKNVNVKDKLTVRVVTPGFATPEEAETIVKEGPHPIEKKQVALNTVIDAKQSIKNNKSLPTDATYKWKKQPDTSKATKNTEGIVEVTIGERIFDVNVAFEVVDPRTDADKYTPVSEDLITPLNVEPKAKNAIVNQWELPDNTTYQWKNKVDVTTPGIKQGTVVVTYPDNSSEEVTIDVEVFDPRSDVDKYEPIGQNISTELNKKPNPKDAIINNDELPTNTVYTWKEEIDITTPGIKPGTVVVTYPDGSKENVNTLVEVIDTRTDADRNNPTTQKVTTELNVMPNAEEGISNKNELPLNTQFTWKETVDVSTSGTKQVPVVLTYPDGSIDEVLVEIEVVDSRTDADKYTPVGNNITTELNVTPNAEDAIGNKDELPNNTQYEWKDIIDVMVPGNKNGIVVVTYPDGSIDEVGVEIEVVDSRTDADKYTPIGNNLLTELNVEPKIENAIVNQWELPAKTIFKWKDKVDVSTAGTKQGTVVVTYPDNSSEEVIVGVEVIDLRLDVDKYEPIGQKITTELNVTPKAEDGISNKNELPDKTQFTWKEEIDTTTPGTKQGIVVVTFPDGSQEEITVTVEVVDSRTDADKYDPIVENETIKVGGKIDLTDNVINLADLPKGTIVVDKTPENSIDPNTPGTYPGVIEIIYPDGSKETKNIDIVVEENKKSEGPSVDKSKVDTNVEADKLGKDSSDGDNNPNDKDSGKKPNNMPEMNMKETLPQTGVAMSNSILYGFMMTIIGFVTLVIKKSMKSEK
ncbi:Rib/alpha-like domain-containing protein [Erysipelothrix rhusiopathiae]|nr:Rib/alpha-like domain-containing protein [Erysipelothrix rhusiopathiae]